MNRTFSFVMACVAALGLLATGCGGSSLEVTSVEVVSDSNNDGIVNPGETISLKINIKNNGFSATGRLDYTLSTVSELAETLYGDTGVVWDISGKGTTSVSGPQIELVPGIADGTTIPFDLELSGDTGDWGLSFDITVTATSALPEIDSVLIGDSGSNDDGVVSPGEAVVLEISLRNAGTSLLNKVQYTLTSDDLDYVEVTSGATGTIWAMQPDGVEKLGGYPGIKVNPETPPGTNLKFILVATDEEGNTWNLHFEVTVKAPDTKLHVESIAIVSDKNDDGQANPGEAVTVNVFVKNTGTAQLTSSSWEVVSTSPFVENMYTATGSYFSLQPGESDKLSANGPQIHLADNTPPGEQVPFVVNITNFVENEYVLEFELPVK